MGWGYKKRKIIGVRYLHISLNATQKGMSSVGFKVGPISWNTRTKAFRFDGPGGLYWQQKRNRQPRGRRSGSGGSSRSGRDAKRRPRGPVTATAAWGAGWVSRGVAWSGRQAGSRTGGYYRSVTAPGRLWADQVRRHGLGVPAVTDMWTGDSHAAGDAHLPDPAGGDAGFRDAGERAWRAQMQRDELARVTRALRPARLSWWERAVMRARGEDPAEWLRKSDAATIAVLQRRSTRIAREAERRWPHPIRPVVIPAPRTRTQTVDARPGGDNQKEKEAADMATSIRTFTDLHEPGIDPMEFAEELPVQLSEVSRLVSDRAEEMSTEADTLARQAAALRAYADYMEDAEADAGLVDSLRDGAETFETAAKQLGEAAADVHDSSTSVDAARAAAESEYGDFTMPRFDRAG